MTSLRQRIPRPRRGGRRARGSQPSSPVSLACSSPWRMSPVPGIDVIGPESYTVGMAMGTRRGRTRQATMWVPTADLPKSAGHPFYERLNRVLDEAGFVGFVEAQCASFYADRVGRPSLAPGRYFRLLLLGYFEGLDSERAIAWRAADSLSVRTFLDFGLHESPPNHSTLSRPVA